ncbi:MULTISPECIES: class I SAM-dependent methyltransferase [unclassified Neisseria]|uniref:class I SAM-dependent methyltransferase n=1 Tax=unclassified Neisseria TaxID=2623750 RepID=UPI0026652A61|nr:MULTISPECIES: class I SAM-dependent methyltransferase [unclassified Neisseria]MDO1510735.1 class I SAM-dependent methyltransferase [Neisseria sp. MVDL19-042950]MDO1517025.1 class I SAM-dependent methyltransferase [Neisseria sp. MVDL18-041461]MDO1564387.1 class I SAM-dependent methyltransferase [Neisseria sp. MVDL20-010259]
MLQPDFQDAVSDTSLISLYMKSLESQKDDPVICDSTACGLVKQIDFDFNTFRKAKKSALGVAIRASYFDRVAADFIRTRRRPVVIELGCGLDDRMSRIGRAAEKAFFYQIDLPSVIKLRAALLPALSNEDLLGSSILDTHWMCTLRRLHPDSQFLIIAEGVLMYFSREQIAKLFQNIAAHFKRCNSEILFDVLSTWGCRHTYLHPALRRNGARFDYGCDSDREMENWAENLSLIDSRCYCDFDTWKRAGWRGCLLKRFASLRNMGRMLHYRIV